MSTLAERGGRLASVVFVSSSFVVGGGGGTGGGVFVAHCFFCFSDAGEVLF